MGVYSMRFPSEEDYERWLRSASGSVNVLTIRSFATSRSFTSRGASAKMEPPSEIEVRYRTDEREFIPRGHLQRVDRIPYYLAAACGAAFVSLLVYIIV